jgi:pimeloyl-ACP methyl ester carboxylesterase
MFRTDEAWRGGLAGVGDAMLDWRPVSVDGQVASGPLHSAMVPCQARTLENPWMLVSVVSSNPMMRARSRVCCIESANKPFLGGPELSIFDLPNLLRGFRFSLDAMWAEVSRMNLTKVVPALQMPVFFFLGRHDHWVPSEISVAYFDALTAPSKGLVWFEESGHEPFVDEPAKFNASMVELVRPVVV